MHCEEPASLGGDRAARQVSKEESDMVQCTVPSVHSGSWGKAEGGGLACSRRTDGRLLRLRCVLGLLGQGQAAQREAGSAMRLGEEASGSPAWEELP